jgi:hypothetical protein
LEDDLYEILLRCLDDDLRWQDAKTNNELKAYRKKQSGLYRLWKTMNPLTGQEEEELIIDSRTLTN